MPAGVHRCALPRLRGARQRDSRSMFTLNRLSFLILTWAVVAARRVRGVRRTAEAGMSTAEYAVGTVAAVGFAVVLYKIVRSPAVSAALASIIRTALHAI